MKRNIGRLDQFLRIFVGMALLAYIFKDGSLMPGWPILAAIGAGLCVTAALAYSPIYQALGVSSVEQPNSDAS